MKDKKKKKSRDEVVSAEAVTTSAGSVGSVARVTEIIASSPTSFEDAVSVVDPARSCTASPEGRRLHPRLP